MNGLIIREPWIGMILSGAKTWELRSRSVTRRGPIALIRAGSSQVVGTAVLADTLPALTAANFGAFRDQHGVPESQQDAVLAAGWVVPWVLEQVRVLDPPVPYRHPSGAVTWVTLETQVADAVAKAAALTPRCTTASAEPARSVRSITPPPIEATGVARIRLTGGNLRNASINLRTASHLFPDSVIGGGNAGSASSEKLTVVFDPGSTVQTDIAGDKMMFRARGAVGDFLSRSGALEDDEVLIRRTGPLGLHVSLAVRP